MCSCTKSIEHRLFACSREVTEDLEMFAIRESTHYCIHAIIAQKLSSQDFSATEVPEHSEEDIESSVDLLSTSPFLAAVYCTTYGLVSRVRTGGSSAFTCSHCSHKGCDHVATLREWCELNGLNEEIAGQVLGEEDESYTAMSSHKIPYPLSNDLKTKHNLFESGMLQFPIQPVPPFQEGTCQHGNRCRIIIHSYCVDLYYNTYMYLNIDGVRVIQWKMVGWQDQQLRSTSFQVQWSLQTEKLSIGQRLDLVHASKYLYYRWYHSPVVLLLSE